MGKRKILVVDDQQDMQLILKKWLEKAGYDVIQSVDGQAALWRVIEDKPDLILTDIVMPKMNGIEFVKRLRTVAGGETVPVIVLSKRSLMVNCFEDREIEAFFAKPVDMDTLMKKINAIFNKQDLLKDLEELKKLQKEKEEAERKNLKRSGKKEICKKCGQVQTEDVEHCPNCGCSEFFLQDVD